MAAFLSGRMLPSPEILLLLVGERLYFGYTWLPPFLLLSADAWKGGQSVPCFFFTTEPSLMVLLLATDGWLGVHVGRRWAPGAPHPLRRLFPLSIVLSRALGKAIFRTFSTSTSASRRLRTKSLGRKGETGAHSPRNASKRLHFVSFHRGFGIYRQSRKSNSRAIYCFIFVSEFINTDNAE